MALTKQEILQYLQKNQISYTLYEHAPLMTVEQGLDIIKSLNIPGAAIKNLFLKDDSKKLYLVSATIDTRIDLKTFSKTIGAKGLRFADAELLNTHLGVQPGSVTPLAMINNQTQTVQIFLDANVLCKEYIQIHPLNNDATIVIKSIDLQKFFDLINKSYNVYDFVAHQSINSF